MSHLPTGVTVVTAPAPDGPLGATANAVTSLSLDPPLMLASLDLGSRTLGAVREAGRFGINVLGAGQEESPGPSRRRRRTRRSGPSVPWTERDGVADRRRRARSGSPASCATRTTAATT